jgi:hypothetical protein
VDPASVQSSRFILDRIGDSPKEALSRGRIAKAIIEDAQERGGFVLE